MGSGLASRASRSNAGRNDVLTVADVNISAHEIRPQDLGDVGSPRPRSVARLVHLFVIADLQDFLIRELIVTKALLHPNDDDSQAADLPVPLGDLGHSEPEDVLAVAAVVEPLNAVELFPARGRLPHLAADRRVLQKNIGFFFCSDRSSLTIFVCYTFCLGQFWYFTAIKIYLVSLKTNI